jgi:hypothetical protein
MNLNFGSTQNNYIEQMNMDSNNGLVTEEEEEINKWKDTRLKKLEDFTKDLIKSANSNQNRRE